MSDVKACDQLSVLRQQAVLLPSTPGVYRFHGKGSDFPIYIGKSINLRQRVLSHLSAAKNVAREKKMVHLSDSITFTQTPGELSALLLESQEVKERHPLMNRRLRRAKQLLTFELRVQASGFIQPTLINASWPPSSADQLVFGLYRSKSQAERALRSLAAKHQLCLVVLGMEKSQRGCFALQLKRCLGACKNGESAKDHNHRLFNAVEEDTIRVWPFSGPVGIVETPQAEHINVVHQWYYLGSAISMEQALKRAHNYEATPTLLDRDAYAIVNRWLRSPPQGARIIAL